MGRRYMSGVLVTGVQPCACPFYGAFVGEHGCWNRDPHVGYKVVFVPFRNGKPAGDPVDFVSGFRGDDGLTRGRPVGVTVDPRGALLVADDLSNTLWRVTPTTPVAVPAAAAAPQDAMQGAEATPDAGVTSAARPEAPPDAGPHPPQ